MKKIILCTVCILSFAFSYSVNKFYKNLPLDSVIDSLNYIEVEEADEAFNFDYKKYLPKDFCAFDFSDNEADASLWIDEKKDDAFDFDHTQYLPVGFNPDTEFNSLFLDEVKWVDEDEDEDEPFPFNTKDYL